MAATRARIPTINPAVPSLPWSRENIVLRRFDFIALS
jgi:hypothetical protein